MKVSDIFPFMDEIYFESDEQIITAVAAVRKQMLEADLRLINMESVDFDFNNQDNIPTGRFNTMFQGLRFECFAYIKEKAPLYVMLSGFNDGKAVGLSRWSYYKYSRGSILCIADPMLKIYDGLTLGWYYGNEKYNLRKVIIDFVKKIATVLHVDGGDIVFIGSSGGGAPVFECADGISGAKAVAINPQIVLREFPYAKKFSMITGIDLNDDLLGYRNNSIPLIKNNKSNPYLIIANIHSPNDMKQIGNIKEALGIKLKYGLNVYDNLIIWLYDADVAPFFNPHSAVEYYCIWFFIEALLADMVNQVNAFEISPMYRLVNEVWYDHWMMKKQTLEKTRIWAEVSEAIYKANRCAVIWGSGQDARRLARDTLDVQGKNFLHIKYVIDNNICVKGEIFLGLTIKHPSEIENWKSLYIIIATNMYEKDIRKQLEGLGLVYREDFVYYKDL